MISPTVCSLCGRVGRVERHHPTRRACRGAAYFDRDFALPLCVRCHGQVHQVLRTVALDWPQSTTDLLGYRLRTVAAHVELFGAQTVVFPIVPPAASAFAGILREAAASLDAASSTGEGAA
jgi:hypothetical protein